MVREWLLTGWAEVGLVLLSATAIFFVTIVLTRLNGLRSFAKMSAFDFATTVAMGTLLASTLATDNPPLLQGMVALVALFALQHLVARARLFSTRIQHAVNNEPILLMRDGDFLVENMRRARITREDVLGQLRAANVLRLRDVRAVVLETTGDVSVLHTRDEAARVDDALLAPVRGGTSQRP